MKIIINIFFLFTLSSLLLLSSACNFNAEKLEEKARTINNYELAALTLAKENRELNAQIARNKYEIQTLKSQISYLEMKINENKSKKSNRSSAAMNIPSVDYETYKWSAEQLLLMAQAHFNREEYRLASDFYQSLFLRYPEYDKINDLILFQAGIASYKAGIKEHYQRSISHLEKLIASYPNSNYFRGAKLWLALSHEKLGNRDYFFKTVDEFRIKYRNTEEWKVLSGHYENIRQNYKR